MLLFALTGNMAYTLGMISHCDINIRYNAILVICLSKCNVSPRNPYRIKPIICFNDVT